MSQAAISVPHPKITAERLRELLHYDPETGVFRWRVDRPYHRLTGIEAGTTRRSGYRYIKIERNVYQAHRLAWLYVTGQWPTKQIDHINADPSDNRWCNLREAEPFQNRANGKRPARNTSGFKGVSFCRQTRRWRAALKYKGKSYVIGRFDTPEAAHAAYVAFAKQKLGEFARDE